MDSRGTLAPALSRVDEAADVLLLAGDLTRVGTPEEADVLADELQAVHVPVVAVLGNHDYESDAQDQVVGVLSSRGVTMLDGDAVVVDTGVGTLGVAGVKG